MRSDPYPPRKSPIPCFDSSKLKGSSRIKTLHVTQFCPPLVPNYPHTVSVKRAQKYKIRLLCLKVSHQLVPGSLLSATDSACRVRNNGVRGHRAPAEAGPRAAPPPDYTSKIIVGLDLGLGLLGFEVEAHREGSGGQQGRNRVQDHEDRQAPRD